MIKVIGTSFALLSALAALMPTPAYCQEKRVSLDGYGLARIGMSRGDLEKALGVNLTKDNMTEDPQSCEVVAPSKGYSGIDYLLIDRKLARIDISSEKIKTVSGAQIGDSQSSIMALYPSRVTVTPHFYTAPDGSYLTMLSQDKRRGIRFETDLGKVTRYYVGTTEAIQYVEGCQ